MNQDFASYATPLDAVNRWVDLIKNTYPAAMGAQTAQDLASGLKNGVHGLQYMTAGLGEYANLVGSIQSRIGGAVNDALSAGGQVPTGAAAEGGTGSGQPSSGGMVFPVVGYQGDVNDHWGSVKGGSDIMAARGTPVVAMDGGKVLESGWNSVGGNSVLIRGDDGNQYYYAHFDAAPSVKVGDQVNAGTFLGPVGNTGDASGGPTHLHIGIGPDIKLGADKYGGTGGDYDAVGLLRSVLAGNQGSGQANGPANGPAAVAPPTLTMGQNQPAVLGSTSPNAVPKFGTGATGVLGTQAQVDALGNIFGNNPLEQLINQASQNQTNQALEQQTRNILNAVTNVGQSTSSGLNDLLNQVSQVQQAPQSIEDTLRQNALLSQGIPTAVGQATQALPSFLQNLGGGLAGTGVGQGLQAGAQVLGQEQQDLLNRPSVLQDLQQNEDALRSGDLGGYLSGSVRLASRIAGASPLGGYGGMVTGPLQLAASLAGHPLPFYEQNPLEVGDISQPLSAALTAGGVDPNASRVLGQLANLAAPMAIEQGLPRLGAVGAEDLSRFGLGLVNPAEAAAAAPGTTRMFHGTGAGFEAPSPQAFNPEGLYGPGYYLTSDPRVAGGIVAPAGPGKPLATLEGGYASSQLPSWQQMMNEELENAAYYRDLAARPEQSAGWSSLTPEQQAAKVEDYQYQARQSDRQAANLAGRWTGPETTGPNVRAVDVPPIADEPRPLGPMPPPEFIDTPEGQRLSAAGQAASVDVNRMLREGGTYMTDASGQRVMTPEYADASQRAAAASRQFQDARQAYLAANPPQPAPVSSRMHLLDVDAPLSDQARQQVVDVLDNSADPRDSAIINQVDRYTSGSNATGQDLYDALASVNKDFANRTLAAAGFDGIQHEGGQRIPMRDENGLLISHRVNIIFGDALDKLTNATARTPGGLLPAVGQSPLLQSLGLGGLQGAVAGGYQASQQPGATPEDILGGAVRGVPIGMAEGLARRYAPASSAIAANAWNVGGRAETPISLGDWVRSAYRGGVISGLNTAADVAFNSTLTPVLSGGAGLVRDAAAFSPGRMGGRILGAQSGLADWGGNFLQGLSDSFARPGSVAGRAAPGLPTVASRLTEGMGAMHGAFQNATSELLSAMEQGAAAGAQASSGAGVGTWFDRFNTAYANPTADTLARAQGLGARAAARSDLGRFTGDLGRAVAGMGPVGDALFPVYRMGMNLASRMVESTPLGAAGTAFDVARGLRGTGPYADLATTGLRGALDVVPSGTAVGPLGERLANNLIGTAVSLWLANQALGGLITGNGPNDPAQRQVWEANGNQPNSFRAPNGQFYSWEHLPPQLRGPMMMAGAYADAVQAATAAGGRAGTTAGGTAYNVQPPLEAAAGQLVGEVAQQLVSATPLRTFANLYDALSPEGFTGKALNATTDILSSIAGGAIPESGLVRSLAQMTDPYQRATLNPTTLQQLPQAVQEQVAQNIPGLREGLPLRPDILGRPMLNPLQGLGELSPVRPAAGQPSPVLQAMQNAGVTTSGPPRSTPLGPYQQVVLTPAEQRVWTQLRGQLLQQIGGSMAAAPGFQTAPPAIQRMELQRADAIATDIANKEMLGKLSPDAFTPTYQGGRLEPNPNSILAPVAGYGPDVMLNQQMLQQQLQTYQQQALVNSILGGAAAQPSSQQRLQALLASQG
jgi:murein DD-endopeptidase MepM/ murein hydrolase activator NlpD